MARGCPPSAKSRALCRCDYGEDAGPMVGERTRKGSPALTLESEALGRDRGDLRPRGGDGLLLAAPPRRGAARPARAASTRTSRRARRWGSPSCTRGRTGSGRSRFEVAGREVDLDLRGSCRSSATASGLPMHGLLRRRAAGGSSATGRAGRTAGCWPRASISAPIRTCWRLPVPAPGRDRGDAGGGALRSRRRVHRDRRGGRAVAFGFHPYLRLPGVAARRVGVRGAGPRAPRPRRPRTLPTGGASRSRSSAGRARARAPSTTPSSRRAGRRAVRPFRRRPPAGAADGQRLPLRPDLRARRRRRGRLRADDGADQCAGQWRRRLEDAAGGESFTATFSIAIGEIA